MLEKIIIVDYSEGAGGEYFAQFLNNHINPQVDLWLCKYFNSQSLVTDRWDENFAIHLDYFLSLCKQDTIAIPYHLYKWPHHLGMFSRIAKTVRAVKINSNDYQREVAIDFLRKIYLQPVEKTQMSQLAYFTKSANAAQKAQINEHLRANSLRWIDVRIILQNTTKKQTVDQVLLHVPTCPSQDIEIDYGVFYVTQNEIDNKYNLLCEQLDIVPNKLLLDQLIQRNQTNWATLGQYIDQFPSLYEQL